MDGKALLVGFAVLCGAGWYLATEGITLGHEPSGPSAMPRRLAQVPDTRHQTIRQELIRDGRDVSQPASLVFERDGRSIVGGPVAATEHGAPVFLDRVFPWYPAPGATEIPARVLPLPQAVDCRIARPAAGARVANVWAGPTLNAVSIHAYTEAELDTAAVQAMARAEPAARASLVERFSAPVSVNAVPARRPTDPFRLSAMQVVVTETDTPVHLVLQAAEGRLLWNLSLAPGVRLSGVTLLGGDIVALANLPRDVPVTAMPAADLTQCAPPRVQRPLASDPLFAAVETGERSVAEATTALAAQAAAAEAWNNWFQSLFGVRDDATRIGYDIASIAALVGPVPTEPTGRVGYHGFDGRSVLMAPQGPTILAEPAKAEQRWQLRVQNRAKTLGGGVVPAPQDRTN